MGYFYHSSSIFSSISTLPSLLLSTWNQTNKLLFSSILRSVKNSNFTLYKIILQQLLVEICWSIGDFPYEPSFPFTVGVFLLYRWQAKELYDLQVKEIKM